MTAQLPSKVRLAQIASFSKSMALPPSHDEIEAMARALLAAHEQEPVAWQWQNHGQRHVTNDEERDRDLAWDGVEVLPLYTHPAPSIPAAVPDERPAFEKFMEDYFGNCVDRRRVKNGDGEYMAWDMQVAWIVWKKRAALQSGNSGQHVTVPDGYVLVPVEPTQEMLTASYLFSHVDNTADSWKSMLAAAPKAPDGWMPEEKGSSLQLRNLIRQRHAEWSQKTFGNVGPVGPLKHLAKEAIEAADAPDDLSEWADMQFLLWDAQRRAGISDGEITAAMEEKLKVNMAREWPEQKDGEPRQHIQSAPKVTP